ncbi:MAG TPA: phosphotransferase [Mycobacteriales bacterium]|nr:phosphotransferase [Mycobacteriales bacterium]
MPRLTEPFLRELARRALAAYDIDPDALAEVLSTGNNASFAVRTGAAEPLVLRIHRPGYRTAEESRSELQFLQYIREPLAREGVQVPHPVTTSAGDLVVESTVDGITRHCDLNSWVDGRVLVPGDGLDFAATRRLGRSLGVLHNVSADFGRPEGIDLPDWDAAGMFTVAGSPFRPLHPLEDILSAEDLTLFREIGERAGEIFAQLDSGLIHVDYILGNCLVAGGTIGIIDFDDCGYGCYLYDLCPLLGNLAGYPGAIYDNPEFPAFRKEFLAGYRTVRDLPGEWEPYLPVLMAARHANHALLTSGQDVSETHREDAAWRMQLARRCLELR